jgi:hypothetical protein
VSDGWFSVRTVICPGRVAGAEHAPDRLPPYGQGIDVLLEVIRQTDVSTEEMLLLSF